MSLLFAKHTAIEIIGPPITLRWFLLTVAGIVVLSTISWLIDKLVRAK